MNRFKGSLFSHLKQEARANKARASRMADVRKLMKKHGAGILEKVRTQKERAKDKQKLVAMYQLLYHLQTISVLQIFKTNHFINIVHSKINLKFLNQKFKSLEGARMQIILIRFKTF